MPPPAGIIRVDTNNFNHVLAFFDDEGCLADLARTHISIDCQICLHRKLAVANPQLVPTLDDPDRYETYAVLPRCGHAVGYACLNMWIDTQRRHYRRPPSCPTCRVRIYCDATHRDLLPLYGSGGRGQAVEIMAIRRALRQRAECEHCRNNAANATANPSLPVGGVWHDPYWRAPPEVPLERRAGGAWHHDGALERLERMRGFRNPLAAPITNTQGIMDFEESRADPVRPRPRPIHLGGLRATRAARSARLASFWGNLGSEGSRVDMLERIERINGFRDSRAAAPITTTRGIIDSAESRATNRAEPVSVQASLVHLGGSRQDRALRSSTGLSSPWDHHSPEAVAEAAARLARRRGRAPAAARPTPGGFVDGDPPPLRHVLEQRARTTPIDAQGVRPDMSINHGYWVFLEGFDPV
ncbi:hypothetical protein GGR56DRAFT_648618 [Xylariaceae sp. FL0804]|nr:hypothetical protein GGR56DRAFT_648618 [Xylariaceae sp. FL0804]